MITPVEAVVVTVEVDADAAEEVVVVVEEEKTADKVVVVMN